jgi:hypothetical protein
MLSKSALAVVSVAVALGAVAGPTAALADPPWARGYGDHRGGPPAWAPAHGWRRHHEFGGYDRPYRGSRFYGERRIERYRYGY